MEKGRSLVQWTGILAVVALLSLFGVRVYGVASSEAPEPASKEGPRADVIVIDTLKVFGHLERPEVWFLHDQHTRALEKQDKDCKTCHLSDKNYKVIPETLETAIQRIDRLSPKFKRLQDTGRREVMDIYHDECIGCHNRTADEGRRSGPVTCGECHTESPPVEKIRAPMGLDKSLHHRHVKARKKEVGADEAHKDDQKKKVCGACHHKYDEIKDRLFYAKGKEGSCRYCHREATERNRISMRLASHLACIDCHRKTEAEHRTAGPYHCAGCHDPKMREKIKTVDPVPRMDRNQPDALFVKIAESEAAADGIETRMAAVPFDHKAHEGYNDTCRVCHHEEMKSCAGCHTLTPSAKGEKVNLEQAMHQLDTETSCNGCHEKQQEKKACIGCHGFMPKNRKQEAAFCANCHMTGAETVAAKSGESRKELARDVLAAREPVTETYSMEAVPETVTIKTIAKEYEPAVMPHRKIVTALAGGTKEDKLAAHFHDDPGTLCQGCHHNSPPAKKPPRCGNCHGKPFDQREPLMPGLMGAYHRQCMDCHSRMGIEKPAAVDCTGCHKEKTD